MENWKKLFIGSIVIFIITIILKSAISNNTLFYVLNIPFYLSIITAVGSFIYGGYQIKKDKKKLPVWYTVILGIIIALIIIMLLGKYSISRTNKIYQETYYNY